MRSKCRRLILCRSYDLDGVVEDNREEVGAPRDLVSDDDEIVVLPRCRPSDG